MKQCIKKNKLLFFISIITSIASAIISIISAKILQHTIDTSLEGNLDKFKETLLFAVGFLIVSAMISYLLGRVNKTLTNYILREYRNQVYNGIMKMNYENFHSTNTADYISALTNDMKMVEENYLLALFSIIEYLFVLIATVIMLFSLSSIVAIALFISVLLMLLIPSLLGKWLEEKQNHVSLALQNLTVQVKDILSGFEVIKTFNSFSYFQQLFTNENERITRSKIEADTVLTLNESTSSMLGTLCQFVVVFISAYLIMQGEITTGTSIALIQLSGTFIMPIISILTNLPKIKGITPIISKLDAMIANENDIQQDIIDSFNNQIEMRNVSFAYEKGNHVLDNINMTIEKGKKYAIVGKSGCGKTTLTKVISGYYDSYVGQIQIDNHNLQAYSMQSSPNLISIIHQNIYMFDTTIKNNITLYDSYSKEAMEQALYKSGIDTFINTLDNGLDSKVGENGNKLSGGQRQRIAIARALIKNTSILILDEGTSAVDKQTANEIESQLLQIPNLTLLTITHNFDEELLSKYDEIIYMDNGAIMEKGTFTQLLQHHNNFYHFYHQKALEVV